MKEYLAGIQTGLPEAALIAAAVLALVSVVLLVVCLHQKKENRKLRCRIEEQEKELELEKLREEKFRSQENLIEAQNRKLLEDEKALEEARHLRHDYRQELLTLEEFARTGNREAIAKYLPRMAMPSGKLPLSFCSNVPVNALLQYYEELAKERGIRTDFLVQADERLWPEAGDLSMLFGNLLNNAVTAAGEAPEESRKIRLRTLQTGSYFSVSMGNTFGTPRKEDGNGAFLSTKAEHAGIGLSTIRRIAEKYDGTASFRVEGDLFRSEVLVFRTKGN